MSDNTTPTFDIKANNNPFPEESEANSATPLTFSQIAFSYRGRISRTIFWVAILRLFLNNIIIMLMLGIVSESLFHLPGTTEDYQTILFPLNVWVLLAIQAKRWHDLGITGWAVLINLVPVINILLILIILGMMPGDPDTNKYGVSPPQIKLSSLLDNRQS